MPWRKTRDAYRIWASEIMLQQTQVQTVIPYYERFLDAFPTIRDLAEADIDEVLRLWAGLGYYSRARNLHRTARAVMAEHGGSFPEAYDDILALPGIGAYTAGAISSIVFGERRPAIDGNAIRVLSRVFLIEGDPKSGKAKRAIERMGAAAVPEDRPGDYNQALMEVGGLICTPTSPACESCCLEDVCGARRAGRQAELPTPKQRAKMREVRAVAGIVERRGRILIAQRPPEGVWGGMWELPNSEVGEGGQEATLRELIAAMFGLDVEVGDEIARIRHGIMNQRIELSAHRCAAGPGRTKATAHQAAKWVRLSDLDDYALPAPHRKIARALMVAGDTEDSR